MNFVDEHHRRWNKLTSGMDELRVHLAQPGLHEERRLREQHKDLLQAQANNFELSMRRVFVPRADEAVRGT